MHGPDMRIHCDSTHNGSVVTWEGMFTQNLSMNWYSFPTLAEDEYLTKYKEAIKAAKLSPTQNVSTWDVKVKITK